MFPCAVDCVGEQPVASPGAAGAVRAGGVAGVGGACALATPETASSTHDSNKEVFICMQGKRPARTDVPPKASGFAVTDQREVSHRRHRTAFGQADAAMLCGPVDQPRPRK